jgi:hypothetical protein
VSGLIINPFQFGSRTKLLLHGEGSDGSTTFTDSSPSAHTVTGHNQVEIDTAQYKFGSSSILFNGGYLSVPNSDDWTPNGAYTIEMWVRGYDYDIGNNRSILNRKSAGTNYSPFHIVVVSFQPRFYASSNGTSWDIASAKVFGSNMVNSTWTHLEVGWDGSDYYIFKDGVLGATWSNSSTPVARTTPVIIGNDLYNSNYFPGHMDEIRFTNGACLHTSSFTPPTAPYT